MASVSTAGQTYTYSIVAGSASAGAGFVTAAPAGASFRIAVVGDQGSGNSNQTAVAGQIAASAELAAQSVRTFALFGGLALLLGVAMTMALNSPSGGC